MKLSDDRINQLSHQITEAFDEDSRVDLLLPANMVRQAARRAIGKAIRKDDEICRIVEQKITSQKRNIIEGSSEWDAIYFDYYEQELEKL
jgi:hypothetical protein